MNPVNLKKGARHYQTLMLMQRINEHAKSIEMLENVLIKKGIPLPPEDCFYREGLMLYSTALTKSIESGVDVCSLQPINDHCKSCTLRKYPV
jgi:hypothetical protein